MLVYVDIHINLLMRSHIRATSVVTGDGWAV